MDPFYIVFGLYILMLIVVLLLANKVAKLKDENSKLKSEFDDVENRKNHWRDVYSTWRRLYEELENELAAVRKANTDFAIVNTTLREENKHLENLFMEAGERCFELKEENKDLKSQVYANKTEADWLRTSRNGLSERYVEQLKEIKILRNQLESSRQDRSNWYEEFRKAKLENDSLRRSLKLANGIW